MKKRKTTESPQDSKPPKHLRSFKCGLNKFITDPETGKQTEWIKLAVNDLVKQVSSMLFLGLNLAKVYFLKSLKEFELFPMPVPNGGRYDKFILRCMESVCSNRKPKNQKATYNSRPGKDKDGNQKEMKILTRNVAYEVPLDSVAEEYKKFVIETGYVLPTYNPCYCHSMDLMARQGWTNMKTHIGRNFASWLKNYFVVITLWDQFATTEELNDKFFISRMANRMSVYVRGQESFALKSYKNDVPWLPQQYKTFAESFKQELTPYYTIKVNEETGETENIGLTSKGIQKNFLFFLQKAHLMLEKCEQQFNALREQGCKEIPFSLWNLIPNKDIHLSNIQIDTSSFGYLYWEHVGKQNKEGIRNCRKYSIWNGKVFPHAALRKSPLTWEFNNSFTTDGISVSIPFLKKRNLPVLKTRIKKTKKTNPDLNIKKEAPWITTAKHKLNQLSGKELLLFGVDPGRKYTLTINTINPSTEKASRTRISPFQFNVLLGTLKKQEKMLSLCGYSKENPPPQTSPKTINVSLLMQYILSRCLYFVKFPQGFCGPLKRQIKWDTYINKPRILNSFIDHTLLQVGFPVKQKLKRKNRIFKKATHPYNPKKKRKSQAKVKKRKQKSVRKSRKRRYGETKTPTIADDVVPVFAYGNAKFDSTMPTSEGDMASCNSFAAKVMQTKQNIQTIFVSEYRTTKDCHMCGFEADPIWETYKSKKGKLKNRAAWHGKRCSGTHKMENETIKFHKPVHLHRDGNAAFNIKGKLMDLLN